MLTCVQKGGCKGSHCRLQGLHHRQEVSLLHCISVSLSLSRGPHRTLYIYLSLFMFCSNSRWSRFTLLICILRKLAPPSCSMLLGAGTRRNELIGAPSFGSRKTDAARAGSGETPSHPVIFVSRSVTPLCHFYANTIKYLVFHMYISWYFAPKNRTKQPKPPLIITYSTVQT